MTTRRERKEQRYKARIEGAVKKLAGVIGDYQKNTLGFVNLEAKDHLSVIHSFYPKASTCASLESIGQTGKNYAKQEVEKINTQLTGLINANTTAYEALINDITKKMSELI